MELRPGAITVTTGACAGARRDRLLVGEKPQADQHHRSDRADDPHPALRRTIFLVAGDERVIGGRLLAGGVDLGVVVHRAHPGRSHVARLGETVSCVHLIRNAARTGLGAAALE
jgi:hypothetical protein